MHVEGLGHIVLRIHKQGVSGDLLSSLQAAIDGATQQKFAQAIASLICAAREPAHAKAGHRVARQPLALSVGKTLRVDLCRAERVVAQDALGLRRVGEYIDRTDAASAVLLGEAMEVFVQRGHAALEVLPVVDGRVEWQVIKHAAPCGGPASVQP